MGDEREPDLPFRAEYAKSGRASCKGCKGNITQVLLRFTQLFEWNDDTQMTQFHSQWDSLIEGCLTNNATLIQHRSVSDVLRNYFNEMKIVRKWRSFIRNKKHFRWDASSIHSREEGRVKCVKDESY